MARNYLHESGRSLGARLRRTARGSEQRPVLAGMYRLVVRTEISGARLLATRRRVRPGDPGNLTMVVKTFERPQVLRRMLASARMVFSGPIIIADDSAETFATDDPLVTIIPMPYDSGIGAGRNALIDAVDTKYLWMLDDDMILLPDFDVGRPLAYLARNPEVDLYGGRVIELPLWKSPGYPAEALFAYRGEPRRPYGTVIDGLPVRYKVPNFYVARRSAFAQVRYDSQLKRVDHNDFFTAAYGKLLCVRDEDWSCLHAGSFFDARYMSLRMDQQADLIYLGLKWDPGGLRPKKPPSAESPG